MKKCENLYHLRQCDENGKSQPGRLITPFPKDKKHLFRSGLTKSEIFLILESRTDLAADWSKSMKLRV